MAEIFLVAGATGGVGQQLVSKLLRRGEHVRTLVRDANRARAVLGENLEHMVGDATQPETLPRIFEGVQTVLCTIGSRAVEGKANPEHIDYGGVVNLVEAAKAANVQHVLLVSSIGATDPTHPVNQFGRVLEWKLKGENHLRASGLSYTIVRPGGLTDDPGGQAALQIGQGDTLSGRITRADTAEVCLQALAHPTTFGTTFEIIAADGSPPDDWDALFADLKTDRELSND